MAKNDFYPFMGGHLEAVPAGSMDIRDEETGNMRNVQWPNHVRVSSKLGRAKLDRAACQAIAQYIQENPQFHDWVEKC